jgi:hypothetical protein
MEKHMRKAMIPVEEAFAAWRRDQKYVAAYLALENEFASATAKIGRSEISASRRRRGIECR